MDGEDGQRSSVVSTDAHLPNEAAGRDGGGCEAVTFASWSVREDVAALKGAADDFVRVKWKISDWNTFVVAASGLKEQNSKINTFFKTLSFQNIESSNYIMAYKSEQRINKRQS